MPSHLFHVLRFDQSQVRNLGGHVTGVVVGIIGIGVFLGDGGQQKDASLEFRGALAVLAERNVGVVVRPVGGRSDGFFVAQLQGLNAPDDLVRVSPHAGRIIEG